MPMTVMGMTPHATRIWVELQKYGAAKAKGEKAKMVEIDLRLRQLFGEVSK